MRSAAPPPWELFQRAAPEKARRAGEGAARMLAERLDEARRAWPDLAIPDQELVPYFAERLPDDDPARGLAELRAGDLYLACGCARGMPGALALFERHFFADVASYVGRVDRALVDEVRQTLRIRLLASAGGRPPQIAQYRGAGALGGWLRMACVRALRDLQRAQKHHLPLDERRDAALIGRDPELAYLKERHAPELAAVFGEVLRELPDEERNMLALRYLDRLSSDAIAELLGLDGSTVRRRMIKLRERVLEETRDRLAHRLKLRDSECDSLIQAVRSQIGLSVARFLR